MISCFFRLPYTDGQPIQCSEGGMQVRARMGDLIVLSLHLDRTRPHLFYTFTAEEAHALADALHTGADLATAGSQT